MQPISLLATQAICLQLRLHLRLRLSAHYVCSLRRLLRMLNIGIRQEKAHKPLKWLDFNYPWMEAHCHGTATASHCGRQCVDQLDEIVLLSGNAYVCLLTGAATCNRMLPFRWILCENAAATVAFAVTVALAADHNQVAVASSMRVHGVAHQCCHKEWHITAGVANCRCGQRGEHVALPTADWKPVDPG